MKYFINMDTEVAANAGVVSRNSDDEQLYNKDAEDQFQCNVGRLLSYLQENKVAEFTNKMKSAQLEV